MAAAAVAIAAHQRQLQEEEEKHRRKESNARRIAMMQSPKTGFKYGIMIYNRFSSSRNYIVASDIDFDNILDRLAHVLTVWIKKDLKIPNLLIFGTDKDPDLMTWDILNSLPRDNVFMQRIIVDNELVCVIGKGSLLSSIGQIISLELEDLTVLYKSKGGKWSFLTSEYGKRKFLLKDLVKNYKREDGSKVQIDCL